MRVLASAAAGLARVCCLLAGGMFLLNALLICWEVAARRLGHPTDWIPDVTIYLTIWAVYLGIALVEVDDAQIRMPLVSERAPPALRIALELLSSAIAAVFLLILIRWSALATMQSYVNHRTTMNLLSLPIFWLEAAVPVGGILTLLQVGLGLPERLAVRRGLAAAEGLPR